MKINNISGYSHIIKETYVKTTKQNVPVKVIKQDSFDVSMNQNSILNFKYLTQLTIESLKKNYKGINIFIGALSSQDEISHYALGMINDNNLLLSPEFIKKMESSSESYYYGKMILEEVLRQLSNNKQDFKSVGAYVDEKGVTYWSTSEEPYHEQISNNRLMEDIGKIQYNDNQFKNKFKIKINKSIYNAPAEVFARLARNETVPGVKGVICNAHQKIFVLKSAFQSSESQEKKKIKAAIRQIEKAITRAYGKIEALKKEEYMKLKQKKSEKLEQQRRVEQIKAEIKKRKAMRHSREQAQIDEGQPLFYYPEELMNRKNLVPSEDKLSEYGSDCIMPQTEVAVPLNISSTLNTVSIVVNVCETIKISL